MSILAWGEWGGGGRLSLVKSARILKEGPQVSPSSFMSRGEKVRKKLCQRGHNRTQELQVLLVADPAITFGRARSGGRALKPSSQNPPRPSHKGNRWPLKGNRGHCSRNWSPTGTL